MRKMQSKVLLLLTVFMVMIFSCSAVFATDLDNIANDGDSSSSHQYDNGSSSPSDDDESYNSITDYVTGYNYTTEGQMQKASTFASPITNAIGTITGFIVMITVALVGLVTALDLLYIAVPFTRSFLNPMQAQAGGAPMGGMGMGGMGMGMRGGMGMGGMAQGGAGGEYGLHRKWVSDEAVACVNMANAQSQPQGAMGGMGGMGAMGGMGGMGGMGAQAQPQNTRSVIGTYLKKRIIFLVIFAIALTLLLSSLFTDCGLNLAELLYKIISKFNTSVANANVY